MRYFGTDGIRGVANEHPMTPEVVLQVGKALAKRLGDGARVVVGKDTRRSGYLFESALTAGLCAAGARALLLGPLPTPAVAHITRSYRADAGIMVTASHNPAAHNGIKLFTSDGYKLDDEEALEESINEGLANGAGGGSIGAATRIDDARGRYIEYIKSAVSERSLEGLRVVLDCANGAAYSVAPAILEELGAGVIRLNDDPDGGNINASCGATSPAAMQAAVKKHAADAGIALDGDADRVVMADADGRLVNGDALIAMHALADGHDAVVVTEYTNLGFDEALTKEGVRVVRVENGDINVIRAMREQAIPLGGEQSGHIIFSSHATTGDGTLAALKTLDLMRRSSTSLASLARCFTPWPQRLESIAVKEKRPLEKLEAQRLINAERERLEGRIFVRYSGTEMKLRVLVEGKDGVDETTQRIVKALKEEVGA